MVKKWNRAKVFMTAFVATGSILGNQTTLYVQGEPVVYTGEEEATKQANLSAPQKHTKEEILRFYLDHPYNAEREVTYQTEPSFSPYRAGKLSQETITDGLNALNFMRYIAGIPADVTVKEEYEELAQTGSVVMARNNALSHEPAKPNDIPQEFFDKGLSGTSQSNIGNGYKNISASIINGYMDDGDSGNIDRAGHRRWILNPAMQYTGFGYCTNSVNGGSGRFTALYAFDTSRENANIDYVAWPAENMPYEVLKGPWMLSLSGEKFSISDADKSRIEVTITDLKTNEVYKFNDSTNHTAGQTPYFNIDTGGYGMGAALLFSPDRKFSADDIIEVKVTGLKEKNGDPVEIKYNVNFFTLEESKRDTAAAPKADLPEAKYSAEKKVSLSSDTQGAVIYYTTDGTTPTVVNGQKYTEPILLTGKKGEITTTVIQAIAVKDGMNISPVSTFTYKIELPTKSYQLIVSNGAGGGSQKEGSTVTITADVPEVGKKFKEWKVEKGQAVLADSKSATTTFVMPSENVTVRAEYEQAVIDPSAPTYVVTIKNGAGSGNYAAGAVVSIQAERPASGMKFDHWKVVSGSAVLANSEKESTRFVMTEGLVTVEAVYEKASSSTNRPSGGGSRPSGSGSSSSSGPGSVVQYASGIQNSVAGKQFIKSNGAVAVNEWVKDQNIWYYAGADSILKTGWLQTGGKWYYLAGDSKMTTGWQLVNGKWYYLDTVNGDMKVDWQLVNGKWYYLDPKNGDMKTGWQKVRGKWYYLDLKDGDMESAWQLVNGKWYYLDPKNGDMKTDWQKVNGKWYYLDPINGDMKVGWQLVRGKWYYLDEKNGDCFMNTTTPDGHRVDENGARIR